MHAAAYVTYTDNLLPSARANFQIPAELWTGKRQDISHLRPFGARGWATVVNGTPGSLDGMSVEGRMEGYGERGTYLLYTTTGSIIRSRDVTWEEGKPRRTRVPVGGEEQGQIEPTSAGADEGNKGIDVIGNDAPRNIDPDQTQTANPADPPDDNPPQILPPRRSNRTRTSTEAKRQADETEERERRAKAAGEEWAMDSGRRPHANFATLIDTFSEIGYQFNQAMVAIGLPPVPKSYKKAMEEPDRWMAAIETEMKRMEEFQVFGPLQDRPQGATVLVPLWVFAHKVDGKGNIVGEKARLVVNGGKQREGIDFFETFAAVMRYESLRILIAFWVVRGHFIWQIDFSSAYLNAELKEDIYIFPPEGFEGRGSDKVMKLNKSIYGTMQAGHNWWEKLDKAYKEMGYSRSRADQCVHTRVSETGETTTGTYTDDTLGGSSLVGEMEKAKKDIGNAFRIKETDNVEFALGMRLTHDREKGTAMLSMEAYWDRLLSKYHFDDLKPKSTPFPASVSLSVDQSPKTDDDTYFMQDKKYAEILGGIQFGQAACRPDITYATNVLSRFIQNPGRPH
jgi:hypothetical protein